MIDEVTTPVIPAEWTEKRMNSVSKTFAATLHNPSAAICRLHLANCLCSCSSSWSSGHAHLDFLWLSRWHLPLSTIAPMFDLLMDDFTYLWMYAPCVEGHNYPSEDIHFLGLCIMGVLSSWCTRSPVPQTTICLIVPWYFLYLMNLSSIHLKFILH